MTVYYVLIRQIVYFFLWVLACNGFYVVICQIVYFFLCILSCNGLGHDKFVLVNGWHQYGVAKLVSFGSVPLGGSWKVLDTDSINFVFVGRLGFLCLMETRVSCWLKPAKKCLDFWPLPFKVISSASWHNGVSVRWFQHPPLVGKLTELTLQYEGGG